MSEDLQQIAFVLKNHQHNGADLTTPLLNLDMQQVGKLILPAAATSMSVSIPVKSFVRILINFGAKSGASNDYLTFNGDVSVAYSFFNQGAAARTSQNQIDIRDGANSALGAFAVIDVVNNISSQVKSVIIHTVDRITGAATAQTFYQIFGTWVNTTAFLSSVKISSSNAQTYPANSSIIVLATRT